MAAKKLVQVEMLVRSWSVRRGDVLSVDRETAERLVANRHARLVSEDESEKG